MMHEFTELYKIEGDVSHIYSAEAVEFINHTKCHKAKKGDCYPIIYRTPNGKPFRIYDKINSKEYRLGYQYGQYCWFDTEEELKNFKKTLDKMNI